jgi:hypothetical protein
MAQRCKEGEISSAQGLPSVKIDGLGVFSAVGELTEGRRAYLAVVNRRHHGNLAARDQSLHPEEDATNPVFHPSAASSSTCWENKSLVRRRFAMYAIKVRLFRSTRPDARISSGWLEEIGLAGRTRT